MRSDQKNKALKIVIADDDADDRHLASLAFGEAQLNHSLNFVVNGQELMDHLQLLVNNNEELPDLVLLDLNMPKKDGRVALKEIRSNPSLEKINVIIFSTSISAADTLFVTALGVNRCIIKPCGFFDLVEVMRGICESMLAVN